MRDKLVRSRTMSTLKGDRRAKLTPKPITKASKTPV
jgi:hypothetical protein